MNRNKTLVRIQLFALFCVGLCWITGVISTILILFFGDSDIVTKNSEFLTFCLSFIFVMGLLYMPIFIYYLYKYDIKKINK